MIHLKFDSQKSTYFTTQHSHKVTCLTRWIHAFYEKLFKTRFFRSVFKILQFTSRYFVNFTASPYLPTLHRSYLIISMMIKFIGFFIILNNWSYCFFNLISFKIFTELKLFSFKIHSYIIHRYTAVRKRREKYLRRIYVHILNDINLNINS